MILTKILDIFKNETKYDDKLGIFKNGQDNAYPERIERLTNNSVTAKQASYLLQQFILGKGFGIDNDLIINSKGTTLLQFGNEFANCISRQNGAFIHVNYNMNGDITYMDLLPYPHCRLGKKDGLDYTGKILVSSDWSDRKAQRTIFDIYNPRVEVIQKQMNRDGTKSYKGQIIFVNPSAYIYPLAKLDPVMLDADSEHQISIYKNSSLRKGFFGKHIIITPPFADEVERKEFETKVGSFLGVENTGSALHLEMPANNLLELDKSIVFKNIDSNIDDALFAHTEKSISDNIRMAFNNIPPALIRTQDGALFSSGGEAINQMKLFFQEETEYERMIFLQTINTLLLKFKDFKREVTLIPLISIETKVDESSADLIRRQAQATLRGSVGGVQALLEIQRSVSSGLTDRLAAITIIEEIFGINRELASEMLGKIEEDVNQQNDSTKI
jgi:hypothetical protein